MTPLWRAASKMSTGGIFVCRACSAPVRKPNDRRNLDSASSENVASELKQLVERFLPGTAISTSDNSYACRPCFKRIEKLLKLRKATEDIEKEVIVNLMHAAHLYEAPHRKEEEEGGSSSTPRISRRRLSEDLAESTPRSKRRRIRKSLDTPTRQAVDRLQPCGESPLVAVCCMNESSACNFQNSIAIRG